MAALDITVEADQDDDPPWTYRKVTLHFRITGQGLTVPVLARVVRLSISRYCSVISTIAGIAAIAATVELIGPDGASSGRQMCELAIPAGITADVVAVGVEEPTADED